MSTTTEVPIADVSAEPDRVRAFPLGNYDRKPQRIISYEWVVREEANGAKVVVDLSCGHTRGRYYALVNNERRVDGISSCMPMSAERLPSEPCARCSKREFEAFAARKLGGPERHAVIVPAAGRSTGRQM